MPPIRPVRAGVAMSSRAGRRRGRATPFSAIRDRIIHSIAFRRLRHKTQVFVAPDGDHFRVRLTHSLEVAQIGRTIARALGLNEDLTEALCLAHDIGHPPFGHSGEDALKAATADAGGFDHNAHTLRVLTRLETPYPSRDGLNLSWETLEGLAKHNGPILAPTWAMAEDDADFPLDLSTFASLEAQIAAIADDIAYDNHDIDDGLRAGLIDLDDVVAQPLVAPGWAAVTGRHPNAPRPRLIAELVREQIGRMVNDLLVATRARVAEAAPCQHRRRPCRRPAAGRLFGWGGGGRTRVQSASCMRGSIIIRARSPSPRRPGGSSPASPPPIAPIRRCCPNIGARRCPPPNRSAPATSPISSPA